MDIVNRTREFKQGSFYLASEFDLAKAGPGDYMSEMVAWDPVKQQQVWGRSFLGWIGEKIFAASPEGGAVFAFKLP